jgi:protein phosphatase
MKATWPYKMDRQLSYVENRLVVGIKMANQRIFHAACRDIKFKGMGTTIVSGQVVGDKFYIAHVGDSRCYRIRGSSIQQMTRDHSLLEDYKDAKPNMSEDEQRKVPAQERHHARARHARDRCRSTCSRTTFRTRTSSCSARTACGHD